MASVLYFLFMRKNKPGPAKGKKHTEVKRSAFGERLAITRKARGMSQTELGKKVGLSKRMISHYEGDAPEGPPLTTLTKIAEALNVTASHLLGESTLKKVTDDIPTTMKKHVETLQQLSSRDRNTILRMAEMAANANGKE
jgi:transcriptional regulator with XRE-family HTH domain